MIFKPSLVELLLIHSSIILISFKLKFTIILESSV